MDFYGNDLDCIHLKFGEMRKRYNFTSSFMSKYPNFCKEYQKYYYGNETGVFKNALSVVEYIDTFNIPVHLYFNSTDTPAKDMAEVYTYLIRENAPLKSLDILNSACDRKEYTVQLVKPKWENSKYRGVFVYALMENINYHTVEVKDNDKWDIGDMKEADEDPQIVGWNIFGFDGMIDYPHLDFKDFPELKDVEKFIDRKIKELE